MNQIGIFERTRTGFVGSLRTLSLDAPLCIVPAEPSETDNAPEWRVHLGDSEVGPEIGAGWNRTGEKAGAFLALQIDDPSLGAPIRANLFQSNVDDSVHHLMWSRPARRDPQA